MWEILADCYMTYLNGKDLPDSDYRHGRYRGALVMYRAAAKVIDPTINHAHIMRNLMEYRADALKRNQELGIS